MVGVTARSGPVALAATYGPAFLIGVLATVVSLRTPLWRDEIATLSFAELPFADLVRGVTHVDGVMLPYYVISHLTRLVIPGAFGLRLPSIIAITIATAAIAAVVGRWWGPIAAGAAGLSLAVNPLAIQQGATARPYALAICFVALAALAVSHALWSPQPGLAGWRAHAPWFWYAASLACAGLMHLFALLCVPAFLILAAVARRVGRWMLATAVAVAALVPLALFAFGQRGQVDWIQQPTLRSGLGALASLVTYRGDSAFGPLEAGVLVIVAVIAGAALFLALRRPRPDRLREGGRVAFALACLGGPWLVLLVISLTWTPYLRTTYLTPSLVGLGVLLGAVAGLGVEWAADPRRARWRIAAVAAVVVVPLAVSAAMALNVVSRPWYVDDFPGLGKALTGAAHLGDTLAVVQLHNEVGVASGLARVLGDDGYTAELQRQLVTGEQPLLGLRRIVSLDPVRTEPIDRVPPTGAVWVVYTRGAISAEVIAQIPQASLGCIASDLVDLGSFGILRLASANCAK